MTQPALVKICGIRQVETLQGMAGLPVDYIGFMFAEKSKRQVSPEQAAELWHVARGTPMAGEQPPRTVGVFVNPSIEQLGAVFAEVPLDVVQLHGDEPLAFAKRVRELFGVEVWRAISADALQGEGAAEAYLESCREAGVSTLLLDTAGGGTGRVFSWELLPQYERAAKQTGIQLFVAGGLTPDNVGELLRDYKPEGVDISSGVETDGVKDITKIAAFAGRVKGS